MAGSETADEGGAVPEHGHQELLRDDSGSWGQGFTQGPSGFSPVKGELEDVELPEYHGKTDDDDRLDERGYDPGDADDEDEPTQSSGELASVGFEGFRGYDGSYDEKTPREAEFRVRVGSAAADFEIPSDAENGHGDGKEHTKEGWHDEDNEEGEDRDFEVDTENLPPARVELMERLCDLVQRLSSAKVGGGLEADVLDVLHAKVDEMEDLLELAEETAEAEATAEAEEQAGAEEAEAEQGEAGAEADSPKSDAQEHQQEDPGEEAEEAARGDIESGYEEDSKPPSGEPSAMPLVPLLQVGDQDIRDLASPLPWLASTFRFSDLSISPTQSHPELAAATNEALEAAKEAAQAQAEMAERVAFEAERMSVELAKVVERLQARKEESDHLHALLVDRAEAAAGRILDLEREICDLEDDILANESELRHLRLKIRAVETVCAELVPAGADPDLFQSIENWKADWVLVRDRMAERKKDRRARRLRLHRAGCVISSLEEREEAEGSTVTSLGGLSMSVSLLGLRSTPRKAY